MDSREDLEIKKAYAGGHPLTDDQHRPASGERLGFWKVTFIGLSIGVAAGALIVLGGGAEPLLQALGMTGGTLANIGLVATAGLVGAGFGINRDLSRQKPDKADPILRGAVKNNTGRKQQIMVAQGVKREVPMAATVVSYEDFIDYPKSATYHRDRTLAEKSLLNFDHTRATPQ